MEPLSSEQLLIEKQKLDALKQEFEEQKKHLWLMSETVYKEKKKIEKELENILLQKSELEILKNENEEKVKLLWEQSEGIHKEKERIEKLKILIEYRHDEIIDSVHYAKKIQEAILPSLKLFNSFLPDSFVFFKPKNIVSGDFFWVHPLDQDEVLFAAVDCTGHGVPGAFMSIMGYHLLGQIVVEKKIITPSLILFELCELVIKSLKQTLELESVKDGMDIALCKLNYKNKTLEYSGAHNSLYLIRNGVLTEIKADRRSIGITTATKAVPFNNHLIQLEKGDCLYVFSDGFPDQKGGNENTKFFYQPFRELLIKINPLTIPEQLEVLEKVISEWKGNRGQIDDMLIIGLRIP